ncbi:hypothetical protein AMATHDRAFT_325 [Amanita thiersii Skay4041]|uniref:Uncharacterized protein n=1 Tax=Amanita thiersii Skay4041 TaxID=703135 RepID=A0A2A9P1Q8_9AGAR|nr:hypothetical protein AMATHDRAFT_325 [Amanita thiersii Skay4041]
MSHSLYTRTFFSPPSLTPVEPPSPSSSSYSHHLSPNSLSTSYRHRFNHSSTSSLDVEDAPLHSQLQPSENAGDNAYNDPDEESITRMSLLGPKMRFHSRAPWELEDETLEEKDETITDMNAHSKSKSYGTRFFNFGASSPRPSNVSRPSGESTRSDALSKSSLDLNSSINSYPRTMVYTHNHESLSNPSLSRSSTSGQSDDRKRMFSFGRMRSHSPPGSVPTSPHTAVSVPRSHAATSFSTNSPMFDYENRHSLTDDSRMFHRSPTPSDHQERRHPYANPDLVYSCPSDTSHSPDTSISGLQGISYSDSTSTVTHSATVNSLSKCTTPTTSTPDTSIASVLQRTRISAALTKEISSPVSVLNNTLPADRHDVPPLLLPPDIQHMPGWMEKSVPPTFSLISLEEARAQRARSGTQHSLGANTAPITNSDGDSLAVQDSDSGSASQRSRARSISAGARAKNALQSIVGSQSKPERRDSEPATGQPLQPMPATGKLLKHKKSGFMRLWIGGKSQEREDRIQQPPMPTLPDVFSRSPIHKVLPKNSPSYRVPVPEYTRSVSGSHPAQSTLSLDDSNFQVSSPISPPKRTPSLAIDTGPLSARSVASPMSGLTQLPTPALEKPWLANNMSQSAPPNITEFPALQLRRVSTVFSVQFEEHFDREFRPSLETDVGTTQPPSGVVSPVTPGSFTRSSNEKLPAISNDNESQSAIIQSLQNHIVSAKIAWQRQIWDLEAQVRELKIEMEQLRIAANEDYCQACGRGQTRLSGDAEVQEQHEQATAKSTIVNRSRARTGNSSRFGSSVA